MLKLTTPADPEVHTAAKTVFVEPTQRLVNGVPKYRRIGLLTVNSRSPTKLAALLYCLFRPNNSLPVLYGDPRDGIFG